jgi:hypothetical protein
LNFFGEVSNTHPSKTLLGLDRFSVFQEALSLADGLLENSMGGVVGNFSVLLCPHSLSLAGLREDLLVQKPVPL